MKARGLLLLLMAICLSMLLTGCFKGEQTLKELDPPKNAKAVDGNKETKKTDKQSNEKSEKDKADEPTPGETVARQLYLLDSNKMVVPQTLELPVPESREVAKQALEYLVKDGPVTSILPNGFQAVLPAGTEVLGLKTEGDTMIVDVSEEFKNYKAEDEVKILEAMTHTLTQFDNIKRMKLWINGYPQNEMPVNGTPIGKGYSNANGINLVENEAVDLVDSKAVTMYFPAEHNDTRYYVPVTSHIEVDEGDNLYEKMVNALIDGPGYRTQALQVFNSGAALIKEPSLKDGVLNLTFNQKILKDADKGVISDEVIETIVRTMAAQKGIKAVNLQVDKVDKLVNENGQTFNEPVLTDKYIKSKKL
ncbi:GerMN domain-containing protein [Virgibacillus sp. 179-BFC.A HS]|uniref:GerMN domain-containing protein n=1 Tax=Tigheibacillus jepli TaxID=3035914 RepID=A0ABU5CGH3_9BACI|nr:GerMN domain-containing protein [Virgibacillus sp. 179-BFC.A HS]MDY0405424.1 GerMN domain-containing protein [Virgibacillus sp. 179-BFC.A HS]